MNKNPSLEDHIEFLIRFHKPTSRQIELEKLAIPFAKNICEHLDKNEKQMLNELKNITDKYSIHKQLENIIIPDVWNSNSRIYGQAIEDSLNVNKLNQM